MSVWPTGNFFVDEEAPEPYGICDRCNRMEFLASLKNQQEWRGRQLMKASNLRVCERCMDVPQQQARTIILPIDPVPVRDPRPLRPYAAAPAENWDEPGGTFDDDVSEWQA